MMTEPSLAFSPHDHGACSGDVLATAETLCKAAGLRLTPVRKRTLEILVEAHQALGAYEVLDRLKAEGFGNQPPVAYRALEFLVEAGLAHRVQRLNAFTACMHADAPHSPAFFICNDCKKVAETPVPLARAALDEAADAAGFKIERVNLEALGQCPACAVL